jgi:hypothetical protein
VRRERLDGATGDWLTDLLTEREVLLPVTSGMSTVSTFRPSPRWPT